MNPFLDKLTDVLTAVEDHEGDALEAASDRMANTLADGRLVHLFGSGHSVLPIQDAFPRYGGFVGLHPLTDPRVTFLVPSMGRLGTELVSAVFEASGFHVAPHPPADENVLKLGRAHTSCKECLPLILTTGTLLNYK